MTCPICGDISRPLFKRYQQLGSVHMSSDAKRDLCIKGCCSCYFIWNDDAFSNGDEFEKWVASAYHSYQLLSNDLHEFPLVDPRAEMAKAFLDKHCDWQSLQNVLEVGSNRGDFLAYLQSCHPHLNVTGVESSQLSTVGVPTIFGDVRDIQFTIPFDLIVARQVLEHIAQPRAFLQHISSFLSEEGILLLEVPDLENDLDEGIDPWVMEHVGHYSEKSLVVLGEQVGLYPAYFDREYQLMAMFRKKSTDSQLRPLNSCGRWERISAFLNQVEKSQKDWHELLQQGYEICFYGASNVFLAISGVLQHHWNESWYTCNKTLIDDYATKHGCLVGGIKVQSWNDYTPSTENCIYVVCAMYRYHRQKMMQRVFERVRPQDRIYAMWTPQYKKREELP